MVRPILNVPRGRNNRSEVYGSRNHYSEKQGYIEKHIDEVLTVAKIAGTVGYSEYHFSRIFRQETGVSVMEYVKSEKLRRASGDIRNGAKIVDTAVKYGWESHNGFTKAFKKEFGYCPALLRAMVMSMKQLGGKNMNEGMTGRPEEHAEKQMLFEKLKEMVLTLNPEEDVRNLEQIYLYACQIYQGMKRIWRQIFWNRSPCSGSPSVFII